MLVKSMHTFIKEHIANHLFYIQNALYVYENCMFCLASPYAWYIVKSNKCQVTAYSDQFL